MALTASGKGALRDVNTLPSPSVRPWTSALRGWVQPRWSLYQDVFSCRWKKSNLSRKGNLLSCGTRKTMGQILAQWGPRAQLRLSDGFPLSPLTFAFFDWLLPQAGSPHTAKLLCVVLQASDPRKNESGRLLSLWIWQNSQEGSNWAGLGDMTICWPVTVRRVSSQTWVKHSPRFWDGEGTCGSGFPLEREVVFAEQWEGNTCWAD
jgi:hypothetical protein